MTPSTDTERPVARTREIDAGSYRVIVAAGLRQHFARAIAEAAPAHHYAIVSDDARRAALRGAVDARARRARSRLAARRALGRGAQDARHVGARHRRHARGGLRARHDRRRARRRRGRRSRGLRRRDVHARRARRAVPHHAARDDRRLGRRQDGRRHRRGEESRRRIPSAGRRAGRRRDASPPCRSRSVAPAWPRRSSTA